MTSISDRIIEWIEENKPRLEYHTDGGYWVIYDKHQAVSGHSFLKAALIAMAKDNETISSN